MLTILAVLTVAGALESPQECRSCHVEQYRAWQESAHAHASTNPVVLRMRQWAAEEVGDAAVASCATCHSVPLADGSARSARVDCSACHKGRAAAPGPAGWVIDPELPVASSRAAEAPHPLRLDPALRDGTLCLVCHGEMRNAAGVALCTTGPEHAAVRGAAPCTGCHAEGGDHRFPGTTAALLARAATLDLETAPGNVQITVRNTGAAHALPTGSALREVWLEVVFLDAAGAPVGSNADDPRARFARVLQDAAGRAPAPAWRAVAEARDTRLAPGETRRLAYPTPPAAVRVEARLVYRRAPAAVAARLGLAEQAALQPVVMAALSRELPPPATPPRGVTEPSGS